MTTRRVRADAQVHEVVRARLQRAAAVVHAAHGHGGQRTHVVLRGALQRAQLLHGHELARAELDDEPRGAARLALHQRLAEALHRRLGLEERKRFDEAQRVLDAGAVVRAASRVVELVGVERAQQVEERVSACVRASRVSRRTGKH